MSVTKHIACKTCRKYLWIGQNSVLYTGEPRTMELLTEFLLFHHASSYAEYHELFCTSEHEYVDGLLADFEEIV
jgi:hypothetical protein